MNARTELSTKVLADRLHGVDALRGWAACGVVLIHSFLIHRIEMPNDTSVLVSFLALGVNLFFVVSAFSLTYAYSNRLNNYRDIKYYIIRRFFRIAPLFYVMLIAWSIYYYWLGSLLKSYTEYLLNITFLYGLVPSMQISIVPAGWSIGVEWLFYIVFPLIVISVKKPIYFFILLIIALGLSYYINQMNGEFPDYFFVTNVLTNAPYFAFGIMAFTIYDRTSYEMRTLIGNRALALSLLTILLMIYIRWKFVSIDDAVKNPVQFYETFGWGVSFGLLVLSQALNPSRFICNKFSLFLGAISYSLYLAHPLVIYSSSFIQNTNGSSMNFGAKMAISGSLSLVFSIFVGWLLFTYLEKPGIKLGKYTAQRL